MAWYPTDDDVSSYKDAFLKTYYQETLPIGEVSCAPIIEWGQNSSVTVLAEYTPGEWQKLLDCILQGAIIIYPNEYHKVWWSFVKQLDCPMSMCIEFINCIENDADVRSAIQATNAGLPNVAGRQGQWEKEVFPIVAGCDKDATWGYCKALWDFLNSQNVDFLEQLNEATNQYEQVNTILKVIPGFELLPVSDFLDWIAQLGDYNLDAYNASITTAIQNEIRCDLFCLAVANNCHITFEQIWDYMLEKFGGLNFPTLGATFAELVVFMITGAYPNDRIVYLWTLVQLGFAFIGTEFLGSNSVNQMAIQAQIGDPDNDWALLCADCVWLESWLNSQGTPTVDGWIIDFGIYDAINDRINETVISASSLASTVNYTVPVGVVSTVQTFSMAYDVQTPSGHQRTSYVRLFDDIGVLVASETIVITTTGTGTLQWSGSEIVTAGYFFRFQTACSSFTPSKAEIDQITISGINDNIWG